VLCFLDCLSVWLCMVNMYTLTRYYCAYVQLFHRNDHEIAESSVLYCLHCLSVWLMCVCSPAIILHSGCFLIEMIMRMQSNL